MIPQHVISYWRKQGKPESWIADKIESFSLSVKERNNRYIFIPGMPNAIPNDLKQAEVRIPYENGVIASNIALKSKAKKRREHIFDLYNYGFSSQEIADMYGLTRSRIQQLLSKCPGYDPYTYHIKRDSEIVNLYNDGATIEELCNQFDLCRLRIRRILISNGVDVPDGRIKPIGCPDCQTNEYSRGLCRNCYHRWRRNGSPDLDIIKPKMKPWAKKKARK